MLGLTQCLHFFLQHLLCHSDGAEIPDAVFRQCFVKIIQMLRTNLCQLQMPDGIVDSWASLWLAILVSWAIALFEYCLAVPANRMGSKTMSLEQLKITQEAIALVAFIPFAVFVMKQPVSWRYFAASLCILGAVSFIFLGRK